MSDMETKAREFLYHIADALEPMSARAYDGLIAAVASAFAEQRREGAVEAMRAVSAAFGDSMYVGCEVRRVLDNAAVRLAPAQARDELRPYEVRPECADEVLRAFMGEPAPARDEPARCECEPCRNLRKQLNAEKRCGCGICDECWKCVAPARDDANASSLANRLGAKWYRQFPEDDDPRLFELRADLLLLVQMVSRPDPARDEPWPYPSRLDCECGTYAYAPGEMPPPVDGHHPNCTQICDDAGGCGVDKPPVCPGCHAVGEERCAPGCIDAELEAEHRHAIESGDYDDHEPGECDDDEIIARGSIPPFIACGMWLEDEENGTGEWLVRDIFDVDDGCMALMERAGCEPFSMHTSELRKYWRLARDYDPNAEVDRG